MIRFKDDVAYWILSFLSQSDSPQGAGLLFEEIQQKGIDVSEATIGRQLRTLRAGGFLARVSNQGHCITDAGRVLLDKLQKERGLGATLKAFLSESDAAGLDNLLDVLIARKALEREAVIQATKNATAEEFDELEKIVREQYRKMENGEDYTDMSGEFHRTIFKIAHVPLLETLYNFIGMSTAWQGFFVGTFVMYDVPANLGHEKILKAMRSRDVKRADSLMVSHIEDVIENAKKIIENGATPDISSHSAPSGKTRENPPAFARQLRKG